MTDQPMQSTPLRPGIDAADGPTFSVIIVNYNGGDLIQQAVDSLRRQSLPPFEVLVVDNASTDGSADRLDLAGLDRARLILAGKNLGFAAGNNLAVREASGEWIALLNPDAIARPDWLERLAAAIGRFPDTDMFACTQLDAGDETVLDGAGDAYFVLGIPWRGGFGRPASELPGLGECFSACGASMVMRRARFLDMGGFDESFFCYCEDVDLGFRLRAEGGRCIFLPDAVVAHHGSAISGRYSDFTVRYGTRNRVWTYVKNMPPLGLLLTLPGHLAATLYLYLRAIGKPHARSMREGIFAAIGGLGPVLKARRQAQRQRKLGTFALFRAMCADPRRLSGRRSHVWPLRGDGPQSRVSGKHVSGGQP